MLLLIVSCSNKSNAPTYPEPDTLNFWTQQEKCPAGYDFDEGVAGFNLCHYPSEKSAHEFYDKFLSCEEHKEGNKNIRICNLPRFNWNWTDKGGCNCECGY